MKNLGYISVSKSFLSKNIGNVNVTITRRNNNVESIVGYDTNNNVVKIPDEIINQVNNDINQSL